MLGGAGGADPLPGPLPLHSSQRLVTREGAPAGISPVRNSRGFGPDPLRIPCRCNTGNAETPTRQQGRVSTTLSGRRGRACRSSTKRSRRPEGRAPPAPRRLGAAGGPGRAPHSGPDPQRPARSQRGWEATAIPACRPRRAPGPRPALTRTNTTTARRSRNSAPNGTRRPEASSTGSSATAAARGSPRSGPLAAGAGAARLLTCHVTGTRAGAAIVLHARRRRLRAPTPTPGRLRRGDRTEGADLGQRRDRGPAGGNRREGNHRGIEGSGQRVR